MRSISVDGYIYLGIEIDEAHKQELDYRNRSARIVTSDVADAIAATLTRKQGATKGHRVTLALKISELLATA